MQSTKRLIKEQRKCPGCGRPVTYNSKPNNRRADKLDLRCWHCVEGRDAKVEKKLQAELRARRVEREAEKLLTKELKKFRIKQERQQAKIDAKKEILEQQRRAREA